MSDLLNRLNYDACLSEATRDEQEHNRAKLTREAAAHIAALEAENARLRDVLNFISGAINWEINPCNYTHDEVCALNSQWCEIGNAASAALEDEK